MITAARICECGCGAAESIALTVALAQVKRGVTPAPSTASLCVLALARLAGWYDWTEETP